MKGIYNKTSVILGATMKDGDDRVHLVALGLAPVENEVHWEWFIKNLRTSPLGLNESVLVISDRFKGTDLWCIVVKRR